jgi:hypothetical protein
MRFPRSCGLGCDKGEDSQEQEQERSALRPGDCASSAHQRDGIVLKRPPDHGSRRNRLPGVAVCVCRLFGRTVFQPAFNLGLRAACRALGVGEITAHGLRHSAATILLNQVGKDLREIQELLFKARLVPYLRRATGQRFMSVSVRVMLGRFAC